MDNARSDGRSAKRLGGGPGQGSDRRLRRRGRTKTIGPVEIYDPHTNTWGDVPGMRTPRHGLGAASKGKRVYALVGGPEPALSVSNVIEFLDVP
jgi:hypothetical protein